MKAKEEIHYICGICGGCFHYDKDAANECCSTKEERLSKGILEDNYEELK